MVREQHSESDEVIGVEWETVLRPLKATIGRMPAEQSGILGTRDSRASRIEAFAYDSSGRSGRCSVSPAVSELNGIISGDWAAEGVSYAGSVHSHPYGVRAPSAGDIEYGLRILAAFPSLSRLHLWLVMPEDDEHEFELLPYTLSRDGAVRRVRLDTGSGTAAGVKGLNVARRSSSRSVFGVAEPDGSRQFERVAEAYDSTRLARSRVIWIGCGGIRDTIVNAARAGLEEHVLVDPDVVSEENLATQGVYRHELGMPKVDAIKQCLQSINPNVRVTAIRHRVEELTDADLERLIREPMLTVPWPGRPALDIGIEPTTTVSVAATDSFEAQARNNVIGLKWKIPTLNSQLYRNGLGGEVTFTHPETTLACHRCMLASRYAAFARRKPGSGEQTEADSAGTPLGAIQGLGALESYVLMALLHHGTSHPRLGPLLTRIGNRNLVLLGMDPDVGDSLGLRAFQQSDEQMPSSFCLEARWVPQLPHAGPERCPDCRSLGDLRQSGCAISDTRRIAQ